MALYTRRRARRSLIDTIGLRAVSQVATILAYILQVRGMSQEDFGVLNLLYACIPVISTAASFGLEQTLRRFQPEYLRAENRSAAAWLVRFVASARFGSNVILLSLLLLSWNHVAPLFKLTPYRAEFVVFCALVLLHFQARILQLTLAAHMMHRYSVGSMAVLAVVKCVGYVGLYQTNTFTLVNAIVIETVGYAVAYLSMAFVYRHKCASRSLAAGGAPDRDERRRLGRYAVLHNFNDAGSLMLTSKTDNFFIAAIADPISVAVYAFYTRLNAMASHLLPGGLFSNVVDPLFFSVPVVDAKARLPQYFTLLLNLNLAVQWPILAFAAAYHFELVSVIFGGKFVSHSWMLPLVVGFGALNVIASPVTLVAQYHERAGILLVGKVFAIYNAVALVVLIPVAGVYGAAIATGTAQLMKNVFVWWFVRESARWTNCWSAVATSVGFWGMVILGCRALASLTPDNPVIALVEGLVIIVVAAMIHIRGPAICVNDRALLGSVFKGREAALLQRLGVTRRAKN